MQDHVAYKNETEICVFMKTFGLSRYNQVYNGSSHRDTIYRNVSSFVLSVKILKMLYVLCNKINLFLY